MTLLDVDFLKILLLGLYGVIFGNLIPVLTWRCVWLIFCGWALFKLGRLWQKRRKAVRPGGGTPTAA